MNDMGVFEFVEIVGLTESGGDVEAWGDRNGKGQPRAMGRFQVWPEWVEQFRVPVVLGESWDEWVARMLAYFFYNARDKLEPLDIAMWFHKGHKVARDSDKWDRQYEKNFLEASARYYARYWTRKV